MKKSLILFSVTGSVLLGSALSHATLTPYAGSIIPGTFDPVLANKAPWTAQDFGRTLTGFTESIIGLCGEGESKAQLLATQEENNKNSSGSSGSASDTDTSSGTFSLGSAGNSEFSGSAFDYVNAHILSKEGGIGYSPLKTSLASTSEAASLRQNIRKTVLDEFFADATKSEQSTTEYQEKIRKQRNSYVQEAAGRHVTLGYRVKGAIQNDLAAISSASLSGDGELGAIAVDSHTLEQMVKMELVDLALQIEMMEADAIQFLMHQPVVLMSETKPTSSD